MEPEEIRRRWEAPMPVSGGDWDARAPAFDGPIPGRDDPFVSLVLRTSGASRDLTDVLDIGCGAGRYSLALAGDVRSVTGVDFSPAMIGAARRKASAAGIPNAEFRVADWASADTRSIGRFSLTIAHMTPAICSAGTFAKMLAVSSGMCYLAGYVSRGSPVWDEIYRVTGKDGSATESDKLLFAQDTLWRIGRRPRIEYIAEHRSRRMPLEEARHVYLDGARGFVSLTGKQEKAIDSYLTSTAGPDGTFEDSSDPLIGVLYWDMSEEYAE